MVHSYWITKNVYRIYSQSYRVKSHHFSSPASIQSILISPHS